MDYFKRICLFMFGFLWGWMGMAQDHACDSLLLMPVNQHHIDMLLERTIYKKELKDYTHKALAMAEETGYTGGVMHALDQLGVMERNDSHYSEALAYHKRCLTLAELHRTEHWLMRSYINLGVVYRRIDEYETALQYFLDALPLAEKLNNEREIASCLGNIGTLYLSLNKLDDAMDFLRQSLDMAVKQNNYQGLAIGYGSIGRVYENRNMLDSAQYCYEQNLFYSMGWNDDNGIAISYSLMGNVAKKKSDWQKALEYYQKALEMSVKVGDRNYIAPNYANLGEVYFHLGDMVNAEHNYLMSIQTAQEAGIKRSIAEALGGLSNTYERQNRNIEALHATRRQMILKDSVLNEENLSRIEHLSISFDVRQKEQTIATLQAMNEVELLKNRQKQIALFICAALFIALLLFTTMYIRNSRQQRIIAEQRLLQLEKEKQLVATQSVLDGETRERARLARDLHDGLGSLLTGAKLQLIEMKQGVKLEYADVERFDKALGLLDKSVSEMRRVAHHLMPDSLSRFGLKPAVTDFCRNLPTVQFTYYGDESRLDPNMEVMIYRSIHELVNNALKHAGATRIMVQIIQEYDRIAFAVQDDGCGFDPSDVTEGMGLQNIRTRVESYNGLLDIASKTNEGTEVNVELRIEDRP